MSQSDPYARFARVYDQPEHEMVTRSFLERARPIIARRAPDSWVLDLACGTGVLASILSKQKVPVVGVDRARAMLKIARERCRNQRVRFVEADLATFSVREPCSVATATGDIVNHLPSAAVLRRIFRRVHQQLEPGGVLLFESLRRFCFEAYWTDKTYLYEGPDGDVVMECDWDPERLVGDVRMVCYAKDGRGGYEKVETRLKEYLHSYATIRTELKRAGFSRIRAEKWSPWPDQHLEPELDRLFWMASKES